MRSLVALIREQFYLSSALPFVSGAVRSSTTKVIGSNRPTSRPEGARYNVVRRTEPSPLRELNSPPVYASTGICRFRACCRQQAAPFGALATD